MSVAGVQMVRDTWLHFLADNLSQTVHPMREDPNDPSAASLQMNAINVEFLAADLQVSVTSQVVCMDVVYDVESTAVGAVDALWQILRAAFYTYLYDYTIPASPVKQSSNILWDAKAVKFKKVTAAGYTHFTCSIPLQFHA